MNCLVGCFVGSVSAGRIESVGSGPPRPPWSNTILPIHQPPGEPLFTHPSWQPGVGGVGGLLTGKAVHATCLFSWSLFVFKKCPSSLQWLTRPFRSSPKVTTLNLKELNLLSNRNLLFGGHCFCCPETVTHLWPPQSPASPWRQRMWQLHGRWSFCKHPSGLSAGYSVNICALSSPPSPPLVGLD